MEAGGRLAGKDRVPEQNGVTLGSVSEQTGTYRGRVVPGTAS